MCVGKECSNDFMTGHPSPLLTFKTSFLLDACTNLESIVQFKRQLPGVSRLKTWWFVRITKFLKGFLGLRHFTRFFGDFMMVKEIDRFDVKKCSRCSRKRISGERNVLCDLLESKKDLI
ncbi:hypothetical protein NPIL_496721 [Nephila pilipes]|uniref:Uncharacterized protein n=1 Tax=Nephila pilipes TaxID=299642 RepID=A0A8X6PWT2_NEPPI|nr:hypothetical protein NPIL_496721 [Nephila pilipes]